MIGREQGGMVSSLSHSPSEQSSRREENLTQRRQADAEAQKDGEERGGWEVPISLRVGWASAPRRWLPLLTMWTCENFAYQREAVRFRCTRCSMARPSQRIHACEPLSKSLSCGSPSRACSSAQAACLARNKRKTQTTRPGRQQTRSAGSLPRRWASRCEGHKSADPRGH